MAANSRNKSQPLDGFIKVGNFMFWRKQKFEIIDISTEKLELEIKNVSSLETVCVSIQEILTADQDTEEPLFAPTLGKLEIEIAQHLPIPQPTAVLDIPSVFREKADLIVHIVETVSKRLEDEKHRVELSGGKFKRVPALVRILDDLEIEESIGLTCYYEYRKIYKKNQGMRDQIAISLRPKTFGQMKTTEAALHFIDTCIMEYYVRPLHLRPHTLYKLIRDIHKRIRGKWVDPAKCQKNVPANVIEELLNPKIQIDAILQHPEKSILLTDIKPPGKSWFYGYIRHFEAQPDQGEKVLAARLGQQAWDDKYRVFDSFANRAQYPLQYVFADYWKTDVFVVDEETRSKLDRLWLTVLIDAYSRGIHGIALQYEDPCIESIQNGLKHAIWPKVSHEKFGINKQWICYGIPHMLFLDNAWANHSHSVEHLANDISRDGKYNHIQLQHRPPYRARYGALVERFFLNLKNKFNEYLYGSIPSGNRRNRRNTLDKACLLFEDIDRFVHRLVLEYQHTPHSELGGMTPHEKWEEAMMGQLPQVPPLTDEMDRLFWRMYHETREITQKGVSFRGDKYWSPEISALPRKGRDGKTIKYIIRYDPANISRIALFHAGHWCGDAYSKKSRRSDDTSKVVSQWEHEIAARISPDREQYNADTEEFYTDARETNEKRRDEQKKIQGQLKKNSQKPPRSIDINEEGSTPDYTKLVTGFLGKRG